MDNSKMEGGRFPYKKYADPLLKVNGIIQGKNINIVICPTARKNHINVELTNQLMVLEPNIIENDMCLSDEKYEIKNLQLSIGDYIKLIGQFNVVSMYQDSVDIILRSTWVDILGTFVLNTRRKFLSFFYKKKENHVIGHYDEVDFRSSIIRRPEGHIRDDPSR
jgi:hypothetical protein